MSAAWKSRAACHGLTELFFVDKGAYTTDAAKAVCRSCPVIAECLELGIDERHGVWGGTTEPERRVLRRQRRAERAA